MRSRQHGYGEVAIGLLAVLGPVLLALAGLVHPSGLSAATAYRWVWLHIVLLPVFPLLALGFVAAGFALWTWAGARRPMKIDAVPHHR
jgi:hypothetical protein